ncbi:hypothetical protein D3C74_420580 [compost metagenome]
MTVVQDEFQTNLFGNSLVRAYKLEGVQDWSGCFIDSECMKHVLSKDKSRVTGSLERRNVLLKYTVPKKSGGITEEYVINWLLHEIPRDYILRKFSDHNKDIDSWDVLRKIRNTADFVTHIQKNNLYVKTD